MFGNYSLPFSGMASFTASQLVDELQENMHVDDLLEWFHQFSVIDSQHSYQVEDLCCQPCERDTIINSCRSMVTLAWCRKFCRSRHKGIHTDDLVSSILWLHGPEFLVDCEGPVDDLSASGDLETQVSHKITDVTLVSTSRSCEPVFPVERWSFVANPSQLWLDEYIRSWRQTQFVKMWKFRSGRSPASNELATWCCYPAISRSWWCGQNPGGPNM